MLSSIKKRKKVWFWCHIYVFNIHLKWHSIQFKDFYSPKHDFECGILHTCDYIKLSDSSTELNTSCIMQDKRTQVLLKLSPLLCVSLASFETAIHTVVLNTDD